MSNVWPRPLMAVEEEKCDGKATQRDRQSEFVWHLRYDAMWNMWANANCSETGERPQPSSVQSHSSGRIGRSFARRVLVEIRADSDCRSPKPGAASAFPGAERGPDVKGPDHDGPRRILQNGARA